MSATRLNVVARRDLARDIRAAFMPVEIATMKGAADAQRLVGFLIDRHREAGLPLDIGSEAIASINEAAQLLFASREKMLKAHLALQAAATELGLNEVSFSPDCPAYAARERSPLSAAA